MKESLPTFEVDKQGLAKILERRGKAYIINELWQNAVDEQVTRVDIMLKKIDRALYELTVIDDSPDGFVDLRHAYTLFAESPKKQNAEKRGRFDLGEKLVIAACAFASIKTTKGTVIFDQSGRRHTETKTQAGTEFVGRIKMTADEYADCCREVKKLIAPMNVITTFNGEQLAQKIQLRTFPARLLTELANGDGILRRVPRDTTVEVYWPGIDETATIYEMGIPVVETSDQYHVNILQRVPLSMERDNVTPGYLRDIRALVLNASIDLLDAEATKKPWVNDALEDELIETETIKKVVKERYGDDAVIFDPSDREANKIVVSGNRQVIHGGAFSRTVWEKIKTAEIVKPAGQVTPSAKAWSGEGQPDAEAFNDWIPRGKWTEGMIRIADFAQLIARDLMHVELTVRFCSTAHMLASAAYGGNMLTFNKLRLGGDWFEQDPESESIISLLLHELAHHYSSDHLSKDYYHALCDLGAKLYLWGRKRSGNE